VVIEYITEQWALYTVTLVLAVTAVRLGMDSVPAVHIMNWASAAREGCWGDASICIWTHAMAKCGASPHKPHTVWQGGRATAVVRMRAPAFAQGRRPAEVAEFMTNCQTEVTSPPIHTGTALRR
jgi:hypothetical protein